MGAASRLQPRDWSLLRRSTESRKPSPQFSSAQIPLRTLHRHEYASARSVAEIASSPSTRRDAANSSPHHLAFRLSSDSSDGTPTPRTPSGGVKNSSHVCLRFTYVRGVIGVSTRVERLSMCPIQVLELRGGSHTSFDNPSWPLSRIGMAFTIAVLAATWVAIAARRVSACGAVAAHGIACRVAAALTAAGAGAAVFARRRDAAMVIGIVAFPVIASPSARRYSCLQLYVKQCTL